MLRTFRQRIFMGFEVRRLSKVLAASALLAAASAPRTAHTAPDAVMAASAHRLETQIDQRLQRVREFKFIKEAAERLGVRVYLFGGTAAGFAHYVNADLAREAGDAEIQAEKFDYDFTSIYRSTQDLDIVIDGEENEARALSAELRKRFPYFQGAKEQWEVRLLRKTVGDKEALLDNPDFLNQHTDSNSTGLVEITSRPGEAQVRDLRDWNSNQPRFLTDVLERSIHFYFSPSHESTSRAKKGLNPPILSAIRFLSKAFQFGLAIRTEDEQVIRRIIDDFDPKSIKKDSYVERWLEKNAPKLFRQSNDVERAWNETNRLGLRSKLKAISNNPEVQSSLAWTMSKEPLRTLALGSGNGKTAGELGLEVVAHETTSYQIFEAITSSTSGKPNVFISRPHVAGEMAAHGAGFYVARGKKGMKNTGWTVRFEVDPRARLGTDFFEAFEGAYVFKNAAALRVVPTDLRLGFLPSLRALQTLDETDGAIAEKLRLRLEHQLTSISSHDRNEALALAKAHGKVGASDMLVRVWLKLPLSRDHFDILENWARLGVGVTELAIFAIENPKLPGMSTLADLMAPHIDATKATSIAAHFWKDALFWKRPFEPKENPIYDKLAIRIARCGQQAVVSDVFYSGSTQTELAEMFEEIVPKVRGTDSHYISGTLLSDSKWLNHPRRTTWLKTMALNGDGVALTRYIDTKGVDVAPVIEELIEKKVVDPVSLAGTLKRAKALSSHPRYVEWLRALASQSDYVAVEVFLPMAKDPLDRELVARLLALQNEAKYSIFAELTRDPSWQRSPLFSTIVRVCLSSSHYDQGALFEKFVKNGTWSEEAKTKALPLVEAALLEKSFRSSFTSILKARQAIVNRKFDPTTDAFAKRLSLRFQEELTGDKYRIQMTIETMDQVGYRPAEHIGPALGRIMISNLHAYEFTNWLNELPKAFWTREIRSELYGQIQKLPEKRKIEILEAMNEDGFGKQLLRPGRRTARETVQKMKSMFSLTRPVRCETLFK